MESFFHNISITLYLHSMYWEKIDCLYTSCDGNSWTVCKVMKSLFPNAFTLVVIEMFDENCTSANSHVLCLWATQTGRRCHSKFGLLVKQVSVMNFHFIKIAELICYKWFTTRQNEEYSGTNQNTSLFGAKIRVHCCLFARKCTANFMAFDWCHTKFDKTFQTEMNIALLIILTHIQYEQQELFFWTFCHCNN